MVKKGGAFTQACSLLITETSAKNCTHFLPFYEIKTSAKGILLDIKHFPKVVNFQKFQLENNHLSFNGYTAIFEYESKLINYSIFRTPEELYSRISHKSQRDAKIINRMYNIDEISTADTEESFLDGADENDIEKCNHDSSEGLSEGERNKLARVTILYILGFFALVSVTFFIIYLA